MTMFKIILYSFFVIFASALSAQKLMQPNEELTDNLKFLGHCDESCSKNIQFLGISDEFEVIINEFLAVKI